MRLRQGLVLASAFAGCVFPTDRTDGLGDGEIHARALRADGQPASAALVSLPGSSRVTAAAEDGTFVLMGLVSGRWLVRVIEDENGDGAADRAAYVPVDLTRAPVPKNLSDGCAGAAVNVVTSVLLGDVTLEDTGAISGTVRLDGGALGADERARVVIWREVEGYATPIEASAGVDLNGDYRIDGVLPGIVHVAAFVFDALQGPFKPKLFTVDDVKVSAGETLFAALLAGEPALLQGGDARLAGTQIEMQWTLPDPAAVDIVQASFTTPSAGADLRPPDTNGFSVTASARAIIVDPPVGVVEILLTSATEGAADGLLRGAVIVPAGAVQGPVELPLLSDPCAVDSARDCDRDDIPGLPLPDSDTDPAWVACAAACAGAFGADSARALCGDIDCDDDGDGQPDVTEPARCLGPGVGTDLDADGLCEPAEDPFPFCAAPNLAGCPAAFVPPPSRY